MNKNSFGETYEELVVNVNESIIKVEKYPGSSGIGVVVKSSIDSIRFSVDEAAILDKKFNLMLQDLWIFFSLRII